MTKIGTKDRCTECNGWMVFVHDEVGWIHILGDDEETCMVIE